MLGDLQEGLNYFEFALAIWQKVLSHDNSNTKLKILWFRSSLRILQLLLQQTVAVFRQGRKPPVCPSFCVCVHKYLLLTSAGKERLNTWFAWPHGNHTVCNPFFPLLWLLVMHVAQDTFVYTLLEQCGHLYGPDHLWMRSEWLDSCASSMYLKCIQNCTSSCPVLIGSLRACNLIPVWTVPMVLNSTIVGC